MMTAEELNQIAAAVFAAQERKTPEGLRPNEIVVTVQNVFTILNAHCSEASVDVESGSCGLNYVFRLRGK